MSAAAALRTLARASSFSRAGLIRQSPASVRGAPSALRTSAANPRFFSASRSTRGEGESDVALISKLTEEISYEKETAQAGAPESIESFRSKGVWKIEDTPGNDEITLTRTFGNEKIRAIFSIADIDSEAEPEFDDPEATENTDSESAAEAAEPEAGEGPTYPIRVSITITKPGIAGAMALDTVAQDGAFLIENIAFYRDGKVGTEISAEMDWKRRGLYIGPQFEHLDVGVQEEIERFLAERGIDESLAMFIPEYAEHKEQKEYVEWLSNVKTFVEA